MATSSRVIYAFGPYRLDPAKRLLVRDGQPLALPPKTFDLLYLLVERRDQVLTKKELMELLWPGTFVEEGNLSFQVSSLRKILGDKGPEWVENLPRYGYRFAAHVTEICSEPQDTGNDDLVSTEALVAGGPRDQVATSHTSVWNLKRIFSILSLVGVVSFILLALVEKAKSPAVPEGFRFQIAPPEQVRIWDLDALAVSPDGQELAFIGLAPNNQRQLWLRPLNSLSATKLAGTELVDSAFWGPDGKSLAFFSSGNLKVLDIQAGTLRTVCNTIVGRSSGTWSQNGVILFESAKRREIYRVPASGGEPRILRAPDSSQKEVRYSGPQFLPDGKHYIYFLQSDFQDRTGIYVGSLDSNETKYLANSLTNAVLAGVEGKLYLIYTRGPELLAQSLDVKALALTGTPILITHQVSIETTQGIARAAVSASYNGVLAYRMQSSQDSAELRWFDRQGRSLGTLGSPGNYTNPALSPDEKKLIVSRTDPQIQTRDLWLVDVATAASSRLTFEPDDEDFASWSPDGSRVAYNVVHNGTSKIYTKEIGGNSKPEPMIPTGDKQSYETIRTWTPDGRFLLFGRGSEVWALQLAAPRKTLGPYNISNPKVSPNGNWVAFVSEESGQSEVYVQGFPQAEGKWQVSTQGGSEPVWRSDGRELFFIRADTLYGLDVDTYQPGFRHGAEKAIFGTPLETFRRRRYQVAANGQRFLVVAPSRSAPITIETNWLTSSPR